MAKLKFTQESARALEAFYSTRDVAAQRDATIKKLDVQSGEKIIDVGCGPGFLCDTMAADTGSTGEVLGIDISEDLIGLCRSRNPSAWLTYKVADATALDAPQGYFDVAVCTQVAEYIADVDALLSEIFRVLRPGGRALVIATDWDSVAWHSDDPERMTKVMTAWDAHCAHPRLPRMLGQHLQRAGFVATGIDIFPLINTNFEPQAYSYGIAKLIRDYVVSGKHLSAEVADAWHAEFADLETLGQYYFVSGRMMFSVRKPE